MELSLRLLLLLRLLILYSSNNINNCDDGSAGDEISLAERIPRKRTAVKHEAVGREVNGLFSFCTIAVIIVSSACHLHWGLPVTVTSTPPS